MRADLEEVIERSAGVGSLLLLLTSDETGSSSGDQTNLLTSGLVTSNGRWMTDMLMVTTTMGMLNGVHGNTSNSWPVVSLSLCLEPCSVGLEQWLLGSLSTGDETDHGSAATDDGLSGTGWKLDSGLLTVIGVTDDDGGSTGGSGETSSVTELGLAVGHNRSFWQLANWDNISDSQLCYLLNLIID